MSTKLDVGAWAKPRDSRLIHVSNNTVYPKRVVVALIGGLGNQMFQRAFGLALGTSEREIYYNIDRCADYSLSYFENLPLSGAMDTKIFEENLSYNESYLHTTKAPCMVLGFWQSEKYFANVADRIRQIFSFKAPSTDAVSQLVSAVQEPDSTFLHVRRGDYVNLQHYHGMPSLEYYTGAVRLIREAHPSAKVFVFSDDRSWCRENLPSDFIIVDGTDKFEDLHLMSLCQHAILANSSFSWWGAWLGDARPERTVVAPKIWFAMQNLQQNSQDLIPDRWIRL